MEVNWEKYKEEMLRLAEEKGWGHTKEMLSVAEKVCLIQTEITELYEAILDNRLEGRHCIGEELADIVMRTLHLGGAWGINFALRSTIHDVDPKNSVEKNLLVIQGLAGNAYEAYRHKKEKKYKILLKRIVYETEALSKILKVDLASEIDKKLGIDRKRKWSNKKLQGNYYK